jgi:hypothetical protein
MGIEGRDQVCVVEGCVETVVWGADEALREGGPPIMPPSRNLISGVLVVKRAAIERAVRGDMALRSM